MKALNISSLILVMVFMCGCGISGIHDVILVDLDSCSGSDNIVNVSFKVVGYESNCHALIRLDSESSKEFYNELRNELKLSRTVRNDSIRVTTVDWDRLMILKSYNKGVNDINKVPSRDVDVNESESFVHTFFSIFSVTLVVLAIVVIIILAYRYLINLRRLHRNINNIEAYNNQNLSDSHLNRNKYDKIRDDMISRGYNAKIVDSVIDEVDKYE
jgi:hypothetical protein